MIYHLKTAAGHNIGFSDTDQHDEDIKVQPVDDNFWFNGKDIEEINYAQDFRGNDLFFMVNGSEDLEVFFGMDNMLCISLCDEERDMFLEDVHDLQIVDTLTESQAICWMWVARGWGDKAFISNPL